MPRSCHTYIMPRTCSMYLRLCCLILLLGHAQVSKAEPKARLFSPECSVAEECFPASYKELKRTGAAIYRFWGFRVYAAALYRSLPAKSKDLFSDPLCLRLGYFREITGAQFDESSRSALKAEPKAKLEAAEPTLKELFKAMKTVAEGDVYQMCTDASEAFTLTYNGNDLWRTTSKGFARLYLSIWLGNTSIHTSNRDRLIG
jgi:hypothetical protein